MISTRFAILSRFTASQRQINVSNSYTDLRIIDNATQQVLLHSERRDHQVTVYSSDFGFILSAFHPSERFTVGDGDVFCVTTQYHYVNDSLQFDRIRYRDC